MSVNKQYETIVAHINLVRSLPGLQTARVVFCPEANLGGEGQRLTDDLRRARLKNAYVLLEHGGEEGFITSDKTKKQMQVAFSAAMLEHRIRFHRDMVVANIRQGHTPGSMRKMLIEELLNYKRQLVYKNGDPYALPGERFTGKIGGACDDHSIAIQLLYICRKVYESKWAFYRNRPPIYIPGDEARFLEQRRTMHINTGSSAF